MNAEALRAVTHSDNERFVSATSENQLGLEIGFHVSPVPGRVLARLGRDTDLILKGSMISAVHVAFELHPVTLVVLLSVRTKRASSVTVKAVNEDTQGAQEDKAETIKGDCVLGYAKPYEIKINDYAFGVIWRHTKPEPLRDLAAQEYQRALQRQVHVRSRNLPTEVDSEVHTWYNTRIQTGNLPRIREAVDVPRVSIGSG